MLQHTSELRIATLGDTITEGIIIAVSILKSIKRIQKSEKMGRGRRRMTRRMTMECGRRFGFNIMLGILQL